MRTRERGGGREGGRESLREGGSSVCVCVCCVCVCRMGKTTLLRHIAERKLAIPPNIDVLLCEQGT